MGIMDEVKEKFGRVSAAESKSGSLLSGVMEMFSGQGTGGLQGLVSLLQQRGLGDKVSSWVGRGENRPISPEEVKQGLGSDRVRDLASRSGMSEDEVANRLSQHLPDFVDKMTPDGQVPEGGSWLQRGMEFLKDRFQ
ncbi:DUF937 domain-containing protein [Geomonas sp. Red875]|uniref:DUF937 domain-containing protein n=2 Tax=Geomesophilobacter sediminis TaxID=2798584 RepID=A0A8J7M388_9BACT|nr:YidB family protein [Geomesophilobacter sediminis]MBJ6727950.1 DUF937 domain-containing protein [Geomesophilobacter sediminis]